MITIHALNYTNYKNKIVGLIGKKKAETIFLKTRFGIHTFGVKFPIDVLILDSKNQVVKIMENLKQGRIFVWNPIYNNVVEMPKDFLKNRKIKIGDKIRLILK
jgi:uncharacterized protein